jgi:uncharacterized protein
MNREIFLNLLAER